MIGNRNITFQWIFNVIYEKQSNKVETKNVTSQLKTEHEMEKSRETKKKIVKKDLVSNWSVLNGLKLI